MYSFLPPPCLPAVSRFSASSRISRDITLLEKMNVIIQLQCDALIEMGYDKKLKEAVKCIWFLYLKKYGYAFQDQRDATPSSSSFASPATTPKNHALKKSLAPSAKKQRLAPIKSTIKEETIEDSEFDEETVVKAMFDEFPEDKNLFENSLDCSFEEHANDDALQNDKAQGENDELTGNELFLLLRRTKVKNVRYFTIRYSVGILYLGLLCTGQRVLPSDLSRLIALNKLPFHNLSTLLPPDFSTGIDVLCFYGKHQMSADKIYQLSQDVFSSTPLTKMPMLDPRWVCRVLLEKLQLPACFHSMLDKFLVGVDWSSDHIFSRKREKRQDVTYMAILVILIKLIYRLDDVYEFEQSSKAVTTVGSLDVEGTEYVYVWEDWITLLCKHRQETLDKGIPLTARDLELVSDYQSYLDFCRSEIFPKVRPKAGDGNYWRRWKYNPDYFSKVSGIFTEYRRDLKKKESKINAESSTSSEAAHELYTWDTFVPRVIPLSSLTTDTTDTPWSRYYATPATMDRTKPLLDMDHVPNSVVLLLQLCADVVETSSLSLLQEVRLVEWQVIYSLNPNPML